MVKALCLITALLALPPGAPAHEALRVPPAPWGINPCELPRAHCPSSLAFIHERLVDAQRVQRPASERRWQDRLTTWYAFNPAWRRHLHPHR